MAWAPACIAAHARFDLLDIPHRNRLQLHSQYRDCQFHFLHLQAMAGGLRIPKHGDPRQSGMDLLDEVQPLGALLGRDQRLSRDVSPRPRQTGDISCSHRIADACHDDRDRGGRAARGLDRLRCLRDDHIDF
jgi:hypothetical protein